MLSLRLILLALAAATLTSVAPAGAAEPLTGAALKAACQEARGDAYRLLLSPEVTRQGSTVAVQGVMRGPNAPWGGPLPLACLKNWKLSATAMATLSADLKRRGFTFVGPVVCTSLLEAVGLIDGHVPGCVATRRAPARAPRPVAGRGWPRARRR